MHCVSFQFFVLNFVPLQWKFIWLQVQFANLLIFLSFFSFLALQMTRENFFITYNCSMHHFDVVQFIAILLISFFSLSWMINKSNNWVNVTIFIEFPSKKPWFLC
jgi:hypothetical protein